MKDAFLILGNQLFDQKYISSYKKDSIFFMQEDMGLCTYFKHHKQKIYYFLGCMREYHEYLKKNKYNITYIDLEKNIKEFKDYFEGLSFFIKKNNINRIKLFEIEDHLFRNKFENYCKKNQIPFVFIRSPMFLLQKNDYTIFQNKKVQLASFYSNIRKKYKILVTNDKPTGGKWSFDNENRKRLPKDYLKFDIPRFKSPFYKDIRKLIDKYFKSHFGEINENILFPFNHKDTQKSLAFFLKKKLSHFGDYEDFISSDDKCINHSLLSAPLNMGLISPEDIVNEIKNIDHNIPGLNNLEGFTRQITGWREFIRFMNYQNYDQFHQKNFFNHQNKLKENWYEGTTNIPILDDTIINLKKYGYVHHIPRLMVLSNLMNLSGISPIEVYKWFMETFIDSSDWVMTPNVFGMGLFSDGGIFATKPYLCGSNYLLKMSDYKKGEWSNVVDGLYWNFIFNHKEYFKSNHRLSMMYHSVIKMDKKKLDSHINNARNFIQQYTK